MPANANHGLFRKRGKKEDRPLSMVPPERRHKDDYEMADHRAGKHAKTRSAACPICAVGGK
jgi:hypothetical protein